jgi:hypothetical protein
MSGKPVKKQWLLGVPGNCQESWHIGIKNNKPVKKGYYFFTTGLNTFS